MILGLLPGAGGGIRALQGSGQHERLLGSYFRAYAEAFDRTYYFSYLKEALSDYTADRHLLSRVTVLPKRGRVPYRMYSLAMPVMYRQRIAECDVLRVFQATGALPALAASVLYGVPYVTTYGYRYAEFATVEGRYLASLRLKLVEFLALRGSAAVIVTTQELADWVSARVVRERVHLIPNGVDISLFGERCEPPDGDPPVIGFVGRLETQKNLDLLIDAAARINTRVQLLLIGEGTLQRDLERQAASLEIGVRFAGMVPHRQLPSYLHQCTAFVLPSLIEGHPKALIEAMACGLPCIASDCMGNRTVIEDGHNGLLFPRGNGEALCARLEQVLGSPELRERLGKAARKTVVERFELGKLLMAETTLLREVAASHRPWGGG